MKKMHILLMGLAIISLLVVGCDREPPTSFDETLDEPLVGSKQFRENNPVSEQSGGQVALRKDVTFVTTVFNTDFVSAGVGAMRNQAGSHTITLAGVSGTITQAVLYWHGPTNSSDPTANANVFVNATAVTGTNIGFSDDNCWGFSNSQAYAADVTALVQATGNGAYSLTGFGAGSINTNRASLVVYFNDADPTNNRDVVVNDGNDSNINNPFDAPGWNVTLSGINYTSGTANLQLHIADGQNFTDDALIINGSTKFPISNWAGGFSVPGVNNGPTGNGRLWDIINIDVTADLVAAGAPPQTLTMTTGVFSDCLALIVALIDLPAGAAPGQPEVDLDIKPTSCPNPLNTKSKGVLPVAILGTANLDVNDIDVSTVQLEGVSPLRSDIEDVATPVANRQDDCDCTTDGPDGFDDLTLKFDTQDIVAALGAVNDGDEVKLTLTGNLNDGTPITGLDCVVIKKK